MEIRNCSIADADTIFTLYDAATQLQTQKNMVIWPKFVLPTVFAPVTSALTRLNKFSISIFTNAVLPSPSLKVFINDASTFFCVGDRTAVIVRGAVPKVFADARVNPVALIQVFVGWSADANRSSYSPVVARVCPERFGR